MPTDNEEEEEKEEFKKYQEDPRIPCQYGVKCYQKNTLHHQKYKHPPKKELKNKNVWKKGFGKKRKNDQRKDKPGAVMSPNRKQPKLDPGTPEKDSVGSPSCFKKESKEEPEEPTESPEPVSEDSGVAEDQSSQSSLISLVENCTINLEDNGLSIDDARTVISSLFLTEMPDDFYQFYELCKSISETDPLSSFREVGLTPVGPFDVFRNKFLQSRIDDKQKILRHWRYFYDPPEFQTVLKCGDKEGWHFGYWRDAPSEMPVFVAENRASVDCLITPLAANIFGAVDEYLEGKVKAADPFRRTSLVRLQQKLRKHAKEKSVSLDRKTSEMQARQRKIVAKTFHKAGIVVPYERKTELGYRSLAVTDKELRKILNEIEEAASPDSRKAPMKQLEEVIRLATIAADECDFGTCLELGHDLFASGVNHVQGKALQMLTIAYTHLRRPQFLQIAQAHLKERKRGSQLAVL